MLIVMVSLSNHKQIIIVSPKALLFLSLQQRIQSLLDDDSKPHFRFIDRDLGQLDNFAKPPTVFPAVVIRIMEGNYSDLAQSGQIGYFSIFVRIAFPEYSSTGHKTPAKYRNKALYYYELEQIVFQALHGWKPGTVTITPGEGATPAVTGDISNIFGTMMRTWDKEEDREDLLTVIKQAYKISIDDWSASPQITYTGADPNITDEILAPL